MAEPVRLAIVGSTRFADPHAWPAAHTLIDALIYAHQHGIAEKGGFVVSGGAEGIDTIAREQAAALFGWTQDNGKFVEHLPRHRRWKPDGFEARNRLIAADCTHLARIYRPDSATYGSGWTADLAERLGRDVRRYMWSVEQGRFVETGPRADGGEVRRARG